jgi:putative Ca2+/H+ antiporter (TMEM165/GDT1 family)
MQTMAKQKKRYKATGSILRYGVFIGFIPGIVYIVMSAVGLYAALSNMIWALSIVYGCGFLLAGVLSMRQGRKVISSVLTALLAGAIGGSLVCGYLLAIFLTQPALTFQLATFLINTLSIPLNTPNNVPTTNIAIALDSLAFVLAFLLTLVLSTCLGFFGAIVGKVGISVLPQSRFRGLAPKD